MPATTLSICDSLTFDQVTDRLARSEVVDGLMRIGSSTVDNPGSTNEYDLLVVLLAEPAPLHVALTSINHHLTDIVFARAGEIDELIKMENQIQVDSWFGRLARWITNGDILHDRSGRLERAREKFSSKDLLASAADNEIYRAWFHINYSLVQNRRLLATDDPGCLMALDLRLLNNLSDLFFNYFRFRQLPWLGEKSSIRYLAVNDQAYLKLFKETLVECNRADKMDLYERLAAVTTQPAGGLWKEGVTAFQFEQGTGVAPENLPEVYKFWEELLEDAEV